MRLLLDTHVYLWWLRDDRRLGDDARGAIGDPACLVHISAATIWEAELKIALGRLEIRSSNLVAEIDANGFQHLPITAEHARLAASLPRRHSDPFDRMLVAQAISEGLVLVTGDAKLGGYEVSLLPT